MNEKNEACFVDGLETYWPAVLLKRHISSPTEIQKLVIPCILQNKSVIFRSATGTGKTFAYLLPLLQTINAAKNAGTNSPPAALILAPTLELCAQIKTEANFLIEEAGLALKAALLTGGANIERQCAHLKQDKPELIIGNTSRIIELVTARKLKLASVHFLVLDEADRLTAEEQFKKTQTIVSLLNKDRITIACSATIANSVKNKICSLAEAEIPLLETDAQEILKSFITHWAFWAESRRQYKLLLSLLNALHIKKTLIFAQTALEVTKITAYLQQHKIQALPLYSGQKKTERALALNNFRCGKTKILVATDVGARGLDIPGIEYVITAGVEESSEIYIHRAGRTARGGQRGICISIGDEFELRRLKAIEKKLHITVYPKQLYNGCIYAPDQINE